nr:hypothetical protein [Tanacetum cinerariifolium]
VGEDGLAVGAKRKILRRARAKALAQPVPARVQQVHQIVLVKAPVEEGSDGRAAGRTGRRGGRGHAAAGGGAHPHKVVGRIGIHVVDVVEARGHLVGTVDSPGVRPRRVEQNELVGIEHAVVVVVHQQHVVFYQVVG